MRETTIETIASKKAMGQDKETSVATNPQGARIKSSAQITMKQKIPSVLLVSIPRIGT